MTAQFSDQLKNECEGVDFDGLALYMIVVDGETNENGSIYYPFVNRAKPTADYRKLCTACWAGYVSNYTLSGAGELTLTGFSYIPSQEEGPHSVHEVLKGDFWLDLRRGFLGEKTFIPFRDGKIVVDKSKWIVGKRPVEESKAVQAKERERKLAWEEEYSKREGIFQSRIKSYFARKSA